ncbi:ABC transporter permease [Enterococcus faecalis]|uniref:Putative hemin transport system permease protein HrtB n=1 Tax=Enterococcus faecalis RP2S-4 TaxID=1244145 RepID=A0ABC9TPW7_ENTFL|nr:FtsX-like permease family protein [Enterococcus faecalis]EPI11637.1 efflux ABC transporter, permease protein [Enterococcus faecalis RP2S-4]
MFVLKHAFLNLRRPSWKSLVICIMLFLLTLGIIVTETIYTSARRFTSDYSQQFSTVATVIEPDLSNSTHEKKLTKEQYLKFGESKYVNSVKMMASIPISFNTLKPIEIPNPIQFQKLEIDELEKSFYQTAQATTNWFGLGPQDMVKELAESGMEISTGNLTLKMNECLLSSEFVQLNELKIGDSIQVTVTGNEKMAPQTLSIAGIYQPNKTAKIVGTSEFMESQRNDIFTNWETIHAVENFNQVGYNNVSYELKNQNDFDRFLKEMKTKGLPSEYQVMTNETNLKMLLSPVNGVGTLAGTILLGIFIFGNFGLALFSLRQFRQRQAEICVLRNLGITKKQLIKSRLLELLVVAGFNFGIALLVTNWIVQPIADWQLLNQKMLMGNVDQLFSNMPSGKNGTIKSIPMMLNKLSFFNTFGITSLFLMTIISIDSYQLFKFEPLEFLLERNVYE